MNLEDIKSLIKMLEGTDITEIDITEDELSVHIIRGNRHNNQEQVKQSFSQVNPGAPIQNPEIQREETTEQNKDKNRNEKTVEIEAPMVGTFYRAPSPEADPFVEVGDIVKKEDTLCIIEAMKLMNEIDAEVKGKIIEILVEDGEAIEYGQPLFVIEKI